MDSLLCLLENVFSQVNEKGSGIALQKELTNFERRVECYPLLYMSLIHCRLEEVIVTCLRTTNGLTVEVTKFTTY